MTSQIDDHELELDLKAYYEHGGNKTAAARARGLKASTFRDRLRMIQERFGVTLGKVADGQIEPTESRKLKLPKKGHVARYILTSAQNNTHVHPAFNNILALRDWLDDLDKGTCDIMVGTYSYQISAYGPKAVKRGTFNRNKVHDRLWYAREIEDYIVDESVQLAPGLVWCGEQNILPTARHPLTAFEDYNGRESNIVPHAKIAMESVASMAHEATKLNFSTGTITQRNYIQKRAGILAEQKHSYGALLAEVNHLGDWWVRQLVVGSDDSVMDVGPSGYRGIRVQAGVVQAQRVVASVNWGDAHVAEMEKWVRDLCWNSGGMLDTLRPRYQFMNDVFSMRSRGHHEERDFHRTYSKMVTDEGGVQDELDTTADFLGDADRDFCETVVVPANHDRHLDRWLNEADFRKDPPNAKTFVRLQYQVLDALDRNDTRFNVLEWALRDAGCPAKTVFLTLDDSFIVHGIENGLHGDLGPNGSRGSTKSLTKLGRPINKGHDHTAAIRDNVFSAGACSLKFPYMKGPNSQSISHILTYENATRAIITMWHGRWRA